MIYTERYRPKSLSQIIGQREAVRKLLLAIRNKKASLIYGPVGVGKTAAVYSIAADFGFDLIELNASDFRGKKQIDDTVKKALEQKSLFSKDRIILIDEIEGLSGTKDRGGIAALNALLTKKSPVILLTNDPYDQKLKAIRKKVEMIKFEKLMAEDIVKILGEICKKENLSISAMDIKKIALLADGDARAAINDLQAFSGTVDGLGQREREISIFNALKLIFKSSTFSVLNALDNVDMDPEEIMLWIDENLPLEYSGKELAAAYDILSKADVFNSRIKRRQHWRFLVYVNALMTAGIAFAKETDKNRFIAYKPITRLLKVWIANRNEKKIIAENFSKLTHCSAKKASKEMPYLEIILENNPLIEKELNLEEIEN